ncbi:MAG: 4Fe-4S dicluster domain-containing protein [Spirochaetales bacterium]
MAVLLNILYTLVTVGFVGGLLGLLYALDPEDSEEKIPNNPYNSLEKFNSVELNLKDQTYPQVHCKGGKNKAKYIFTYRGLDDCTALYALFQGNKVCKYACLEMGSCIRLCPVGAIHYDPTGTVWVDRETCTSCGLCVQICPTGVLRFLPRNADYLVACNSLDDGSKTLESCSVGCTGCRICERRLVDGGFFIERNLARINYKRHGERKYAAEDCPTKCIIKHYVEE